MLKLILVFVAAIILLVALLYFFQHKMIYFPRRYHDRLQSYLGQGVKEIRYRIGHSEQISYYHAKNKEKLPDRIWMVMGGNASLALGWVDRLIDYPDSSTGFFLFDYPGYGQCEGSPSPEAILEATKAGIEALAHTLDCPVDTLHARMSILGHSLGAAAALQYAAQYPVQQLVLIAPFTSMEAMARESVGPVLSLLLQHHYDNEQRLREIIQQKTPPSITIVHGELDTIIPVEMGRELAALFSEHISYLEIAGGDHNQILDGQLPTLFRTMTLVPISKEVDTTTIMENR
jgi:uncharacterized protein